MGEENKDPLVSCLCCTYNRPVLLGESIECFLQQDYANKELIIVNDQEGVTLSVKDCPANIKMFNVPKRFNSLGEKRNYSKTLGNGEYFCIWDDDDLYTPFRISESVYFMNKCLNCDILKAKDAVISIDNKVYKWATNRFHAQAIVRREYMLKADYPPKSIGEDNVFERGARIENVDISPSFWAILRWGMNEVYHISCVPSALEKKSWEVASKLANLKGDIVIEPKFQQDYWADIKKMLNDNSGHLGYDWYDKIGRKND